MGKDILTIHFGQLKHQLYHVRVDLALQKPLITHKPNMALLPNLEDRLLYSNASKEFGQTPGNQASQHSPYTSTSATTMFTIHKGILS